MTRLAKRYARALLEAAVAGEAVDAVAADLEHIAAELRRPQVAAMLLDPHTSRERRRAWLAKIAGECHLLTDAAIDVTVARRREAVWEELPAAFAALVRALRGEVAGVAETARALDDDQVRELEQNVAAQIGHKVTLRAQVRPELVGGVRVRVGNTLFDGSIAAVLEDLERRLIEVPLPVS